MVLYTLALAPARRDGRGRHHRVPMALGMGAGGVFGPRLFVLGSANDLSSQAVARAKWQAEGALTAADQSSQGLAHR